MDVIAELRRVLPGISIGQAEGSALKLGPRHLQMVKKVYPALRVSDLEAQLAWLSVEQRRDDRQTDGAILVAVFPELREPHAQRIRNFLMHCDPRPDLVLISRAGGHLLQLTEPFREDWVPDSPATSPQLVTNQVTKWLWSDHYQWLLSTLAFRHLSSNIWGGPRGPWKSVEEWADACGVSLAVAYRCLGAMRQRGWIAGAKKLPDQLIESRRVGQAWIEWARTTDAQSIPVRPWRGKIDRTWLRTHVPASPPVRDSLTRCALTGWHALKAHHQDFVTNIPDERALVIDGSAGAWLERLGLVVCDPRDAQATVILASKSLTHFGALTAKDGIAIVDAWQAAMSVVSDPRRGLEQAESVADSLWTTL